MSHCALLFLFTSGQSRRRVQHKDSREKVKIEESSFDVTCNTTDLDEERPRNRHGSPIACPKSADREEVGPSRLLPSRMICTDESCAFASQNTCTIVHKWRGIQQLR